MFRGVGHVRGWAPLTAPASCVSLSDSCRATTVASSSPEDVLDDMMVAPDTLEMDMTEDLSFAGAPLWAEWISDPRDLSTFFLER